MQSHLFLDRDGTIIREQNYLRDPLKVSLESDLIAGLLRFQALGFRLVVVSNQSGVGRGLITEDDVMAVNVRSAELLADQGVIISSWHHCPHRPDQGCSCRKPASGLFLEASAIHSVDWLSSFMVGDKPSDVQAGLALGMKAALITTGYGSCHVAWARAHDVPVVTSLNELADLFLP